jgi:hypothetical protein
MSEDQLRDVINESFDSGVVAGLDAALDGLDELHDHGVFSLAEMRAYLLAVMERVRS